MKKYLITITLLFVSALGFTLGAESFNEISQQFLSPQDAQSLLDGEFLSYTLGTRGSLKYLPPVEAAEDIQDDIRVLRGDIAMEFIFFVPFTDDLQRDPLWQLNQYLAIEDMTNATFYGSRSGEEARLFTYASRVDSPKRLNPLPSIQYDELPEEFDFYSEVEMNKIGQMVLDAEGEVMDNNELYIYLETTNTLKYSIFKFLKPRNLHMHVVTKPLDDGILVYNSVFVISPSTRFLSALGLGGTIEEAIYSRMSGFSNWFRNQITIE